MRPTNVTERLARASARRKWLVIGAWTLAVLASAVAIAGLLGSALTTYDDFTDRPEAERAERILERAFPPVRADRGFDVDEAVIVSSHHLTAEDPRFERRMTSLAARAGRCSASRSRCSSSSSSSAASRPRSCRSPSRSRASSLRWPSSPASARRSSSTSSSSTCW